ncbi:MAG: hypothetical protein KKH98_12770, partial [Spirochaetes bacterium]|nr:hypothetical protein [Spirochaetota bacterium]
MQISMINFNINSDHGPKINPLRNETDNSFINILENKIEKLESIEKKIMSDRKKEQDKIKEPVRTDPVKNKKTDNYEADEKKVRAEKSTTEQSRIKNTSDDTSSIRALFQEIASFLQKVKGVDENLFKQFQKEFNVIKSGIISLLKGKEIRENNFILKLKDLLKNLKKAYLLKQNSVPNEKFILD